jgi:hypothetical protein
MRRARWTSENATSAVVECGEGGSSLQSHHCGNGVGVLGAANQRLLPAASSTQRKATVGIERRAVHETILHEVDDGMRGRRRPDRRDRAEESLRAVHQQHAADPCSQRKADQGKQQGRVADGLSGRSLGRRRALHALILAASQMVVNRYGGCHGGWSKGQPIDEILSSSPMTKQR